MKKNNISKFTQGGGIIWYITNYPQGLVKLLLLLFLILNSLQKNLSAQVSCGFETNFDIESFESIIGNDPQTSGLPSSNAPIQIPLVFHVIYLDGDIEEEIGSTNISLANIKDCVAKLNSDFNSPTFNVSFCLAKRDPANNITDGVERVNGSVVAGYDNYGYIPYSNETELKQLGQKWSNLDYVNVWVVSKITSSGNEVGLAYFPNATSDNLDGIVIDFNYVDGLSSVLAHEMGHFFGLYHTFEGGTENDCPDNIICDMIEENDKTEICCRNQGDHVCDTPPHKKEFGCPTGLNNCTNTNYNEVTHNIMSYYGCTDRIFSSGQYLRMGEVFMKYRPYLLNSPACSPPCNSVEAKVNFEEIYYFTQSGGITIENISTGNIDYSEWHVLSPSSSHEVLKSPGKVDHYYVVQELGKHSFCLTVNDENCVDRKCDYFISVPQESNCILDSYCNLIKNSKLEINNVNGITFHYNPGGPNFEKICNWYNARNTPFYCEFNNNQKSLGMFCHPKFVDSEHIGNTEKLNLIDGEEYEISFKYHILSETSVGIKELNVLSYKEIPTLTNTSSYYAILQLNNVGADEVIENFGGENTPCYTGEKTFNDVSYIFTYDANLMGGYFVFFGLNFSVHPRSVLYITDFKVSRCVGTCGGEISIGVERIDDCTYEFAAITEDPVQDYTWEFSCEESIHGSPIVTHSFLYPGLQEVCLIVNCDNSTTKICEQVNIPETCFSLNCDNITTNTIPVVKCSTTEDTYIANFEFNVPKGYKPCSENDCFIGDVNIEEHSYIIDTSNPLHDVLKFAVEIANAQVGQIFSFSLCGPNGGVLCYQYTISAINECTTCTTLSANAICVDNNANDGILEYTGSINVPLGYFDNLCGVNSSEAGFSITNVNSSQNITTINFNLNTIQEGSSQFESIICFEVNSNFLCYKIIISIPDPCSPENCEELPVGAINCSSVSIEGNVVFNLSTAFYKNYIGEGFVLCETDGISISEGVYSLIDANYNFTPDRFDIELEFILDCDDLRSGLNEVQFELHFCNEQGVLKCLILNVPIECIECSREGEGRSRVKSSNYYSDMKIFPNPANTDLYVNINSDYTPNRSLRIYNSSGQVVVFRKDLLQKNQIKIDYLPSGLYFIEILDHLNVGFKEKLLIFR